MDTQAFWTWWQQLKSYGSNSDGSLSRLAFTDSDMASRRWLQQLWTQYGARTTIDPIGNVIGVYGCAPYLLISSHTDSVPHGGHYDGIIGVLGATWVLQQWRPQWGGLMVIDWSSEESSRFGISTLGSRLACGQPTVDWNRRDNEGVTLGDAVQKAFGGSQHSWQLPADKISASLELHIEQGGLLADADRPLAVVTAIAAPQRWALTISGEANHSGSTLMAHRHDALSAAARLVEAIEEESRHLESSGLHATVTDLHVAPGSANVIPNEARLLLDIRAQSSRVLTGLTDKFPLWASQLATSRGVHLEAEPISQEQPGQLDADLQTQIAEQIELEGLPVHAVASWPSHDSLPLSRKVPAGMIFVRNLSRVSHQPGELVASMDIDQGLEVLYRSAQRISSGFHGNTGTR